MKKTAIKRVMARQLLDCGCRPMVEVDVITEGGTVGRGSAPTGSSVGMHESFVLRDNDPAQYNGLSVHKAVWNVENIIAPQLIGRDVMDQRAIDETMAALDGTKNKSRLGGNTIGSVSIACLRAAAETQGLPAYRYLAGKEVQTVPIPSFNVINGGRYGEITLAFNEFILVPYKAENIEQAIEIGVSVFKELGKVIGAYLEKEPSVARSYGWAAPSEDPEIVLGLMEKAAACCGYSDKVAFAIDCASSEMYDEKSNTYYLKGKRVTSDELIEYTDKLSRQFPLVFVEDLLHEDDWEGYQKATRQINNTIIIGDDLTVTNIERIRKAHEMRAIDGFIFKPNQVGSITDALEAHHFARQHNMLTIPSGRAGGVIDDVVMDMAVGLQVPLIKNGAPRSGERISKLNFLMRAASLAPGCKLSQLNDVVKFTV